MRFSRSCAAERRCMKHARPHKRLSKSIIPEAAVEKKPVKQSGMPKKGMPLCTESTAFCAYSVGNAPGSICASASAWACASAAASSVGPAVSAPAWTSAAAFAPLTPAPAAAAESSAGKAAPKPAFAATSSSVSARLAPVGAAAFSGSTSPEGFCRIYAPLVSFLYTSTTP